MTQQGYSPKEQPRPDKPPPSLPPGGNPRVGSYRLGRSLGTTIYKVGEDDQPVAWFPNRPKLAATVVNLLNVYELSRTMIQEDGDAST